MSSPFRTVSLSAELVDEANKAFDWRAATELPNGLMLGRMFEHKRAVPQTIPDKRIVQLNSIVGLQGKSVLEIGCFEGIHTIGLRTFTDNVTAIDVRPTNVFKALARLSFHGADAKVFVADCEKLDQSFGQFDVIFHFGVLYHLMQPVQHLKALGAMGDILFLDTHVAASEAELGSENVDGRDYQFALFNEGGWTDPFSGKDDSSKHLTLASLQDAIGNAGFSAQRLLNFRMERNGPRVLIIASRTLTLEGVASVSPDAPTS
ncbi:MAG: class I SAM-dependent methyltransferase [Hyphomonadaceae bacterium]|nr:class I SAM-dependent methyltransferase [Hyphomonadaceae bacterium]